MMNFASLGHLAGRHRTAIKVVIWSFVAFFVFMAIEAVHVRTRERFTCLYCRLEHVSQSFAEYQWDTFTTNEFTEWYGTYKPSHAHQWEQSSCTVSRSVFGLGAKFSCRRPHPIFLLPPNIELRFVKVAKPHEIQGFFESLCSTNQDEQRLAVDKAWKTVLEED